MIPDRQLQLSLTKALALVLWAVVVAALALFAATQDELLAYIGLACSAAAATAHMRSFMCDFSRRQKEAFEFGREVERKAQRDLRSVT